MITGYINMCGLQFVKSTIVHNENCVHLIPEPLVHLQYTQTFKSFPVLTKTYYSICITQDMFF